MGGKLSWQRFTRGRISFCPAGLQTPLKRLSDRLIADTVFHRQALQVQVKVAGRFADLWRARTGQGTQTAHAHACPPAHRGSSRPGSAFGRIQAGRFAADVEPAGDVGRSLARWTCGLDDPQPGEEIVRDRIDEGRLRDRIGEGRMYVWDDQGHLSRWRLADGPTPRGNENQFRLHTSGVHRGRGYASACVADLSQLLLDDGAPLLRAVHGPCQSRLQPAVRAAGLPTGV